MDDPGSHLTPQTPPLNQRDPRVGDPAGFDPLRLCVYATVALIVCAAGPPALTVFALIGVAGYVRARRAGLLRSRCRLGDTRLVIGYLVALALLGIAATPLWLRAWVWLLGS